MDKEESAITNPGTKEKRKSLKQKEKGDEFQTKEEESIEEEDSGSDPKEGGLFDFSIADPKEKDKKEKNETGDPTPTPEDYDGGEYPGEDDEDDEETEDVDESEGTGEEDDDSSELEMVGPEEDEDDDFYGIGFSEVHGAPSHLPIMKSRFAMSNQEIQHLIDPNNQRAFNENIAKLNQLLEDTQNEYCALNLKATNPEINEFRLTRDILEKLVYQDELDLPGNFLDRTIGRRLNDEDMKDIADFLMRDTQVIQINLAYNNIGDEGVMILSGVLLVRPDILYVNLAHNDMTPHGFYTFTEYLMQRPQLFSLKVSGMKIGDEGFNGLICLVLCGRGPHDLDVSETDMSMVHFQGLCSAWQAIDNDEDFPKFLAGRKLPIPLGVLADMKYANNEDKRRQNTLAQRRSVLELVRKSAGAGAGGDNGGGFMEKIPDLSRESSPNKIPNPMAMLTGVGVSNNPADLSVTSLISSEMLERVSSTILKGLFEIPELKHKPRNLKQVKTTIDRAAAKIDRITTIANELPDTAQVIEEYKKIRESGCLPIDDDGKPIIVCPSLYSLEVDPMLDDQGGHVGHFIHTALEDIVDGAKEMNQEEEKHSKVPDDETAKDAAVRLVDSACWEAAKFLAGTNFDEKSDAAQLLLAVVLDTCQRIRRLQDENKEFSDEDLEMIWDFATENAANLIESKIPEGRCNLTRDEVMAFVRKFMESTNRTLLSLLDNPFIPPLLFDVGTRACKEMAETEMAKPIIPSLFDTSSLLNNPDEQNYAQKIVMKFLEGAIGEAAAVIGSSDPYSFKTQPDEDALKTALNKSKVECDETEKKVEGLVQNFILAGAFLADDTNNTYQDLDAVVDYATGPALSFLEETFDKVADLLIETRNSAKETVTQNELQFMKFPFASRPTRLVLNRPLFQDFEAVMASKIGDFLRDNATVRCVHLRKWGLGEDGMMNLMEGLQLNTNIVLLDLGSNAIGPEGAKGLAKFVENNRNLKHLILNHNRLRNPGLKYLAQGLATSSVEYLNIAHNNIGEALDNFLETLPQTQVRALYAIGNSFTQQTWKMLQHLLDTEWLVAEYCDFKLQDVDGQGMIVKNAQIRDVNEWYDVPPMVAKGLYRAPYFEEYAHIKVLKT